jgi:acyl carrier protein
METITDEVGQIVARELNIPVERLTPDTSLQDLGVESLDMIELVFALEDKFNISIPYNANAGETAGKAGSAKVGTGKLTTIAQISAAIKRLVDAKIPA